MKKTSRLMSGLIALPIALAAVACSGGGGSSDSSTEAVRSITPNEALADFDQIAESFRSLYGAKARKEKRYGFKFEEVVTKYRAQVAAGKSEAERIGAMKEFLAVFRDAHISLSFDLISDKAHAFRLPFGVAPVESAYLVYDAGKDPAMAAVARGDELVSIDGVPAAQLAATFDKYTQVENPLSTKHFSAARLTTRSIYMSHGLTNGKKATLVFKKPDGSLVTAKPAWTEIPHLLPKLAAPTGGGTHALQYASVEAFDVIRDELASMGARTPFFMTPEAKAALGVTDEVKPSAAALTKFAVTDAQAQAAGYYATTYTHAGKKILLLRLPDYEPQDMNSAFNYVRALLDEQQPLVDGLVFDNSHNPGGIGVYSVALVSLLSSKPGNGFVEMVHADRKWISMFAGAAADAQAQNDPSAPILSTWAHQIDDAYSAEKQLSPAIPMGLTTDGTLQPDDKVSWKKPVVMLADELSVSCGDIVPLLAKANGLATVFGETTMGGGGNVEQVATLTNTQGALSISRGLNTVYDPTGAYPDAAFIEDNGVVPDVHYAHTVADFRAGYVGYVNAFSDALVAKMAP